jgi:hypothetical protein
MSNSTDNGKSFGLRPFQRNRYFYGKLMSVRDFETEQSYMNEKRHLLNRLVNGCGIVCGLTIDDLEVSVGEGNIKIRFKSGGLALDCWGREVVVPAELEPQEIFIKEGSTKTHLTAVEAAAHAYYLYLEYDPREGELVSSALENSSCEETCCPNRIIENFEVVASRQEPQNPPIACPAAFGNITQDTAKKRIKEWLKTNTSELGARAEEGKIFFLALKKSSTPGSDVAIDEAETRKHLTFVAHNRVLSELLTCHLADFNNPHKTTAQEVGALASIDGVHNDGGDVDLIQANSIIITPDNGANTITIGENHSARQDNPHQISAQQVGALSTEGGMVTGKVYIKTQEWDGLAADATKTYGIMGRLTEDLDSGSDYRCAGVVGVSEIGGKHGLYARAPAGSHALYVEGSAMFTGAKSGFVADIFRNASGTTLKTGDLVKLKGTKVHRYYGQNHQIPVADVTLADQPNDSAVIGIVDSRAVLDEEEPKKKSKKAPDPTLVEDGQELYVVTLGCYARCQVDADKEPIAVGDLLTSSATPGHARKAAAPKIGTIIGKALEPLKKGTGSIAVFVNLQ